MACRGTILYFCPPSYLLLLCWLRLRSVAATNCKETPLLIAASNDHESVARLLLDRGASIDAATSDNWTSLHYAAENGYESIVRLLLDRGASIDAATSDNWTSFHFAADKGHESVVGLLLDCSIAS